jgi:hypothetical protein
MPLANVDLAPSPAAQARVTALPHGTPAWVTAELVQLTLRIWQPFYNSVLTSEDAVTMILRVGQLFGVLSRE